MKRIVVMLAVGLGSLSSLGGAPSPSNQPDTDTDTAQYFGKPILHRKIPIPAALLSNDNDLVGRFHYRL